MQEHAYLSNIPGINMVKNIIDPAANLGIQRNNDITIDVIFLPSKDVIVL